MTTATTFRIWAGDGRSRGIQDSGSVLVNELADGAANNLPEPPALARQANLGNNVVKLFG